MRNNYTLFGVASIAIIAAELVAIPAIDNHQQQANALIFKDKQSNKLKNFVKKIAKIFDINIKGSSGGGGDH